MQAPWFRELYKQVNRVAICPEEAAGFPTPREPMRFLRSPTGVSLQNKQSTKDLTPILLGQSREAVSGLPDLDGALVKSKSPSCAIDDCKVFDADQRLVDTKEGLFVQALLERFPNLPILDEKKILDEDARTQFFIFLLQKRNLRTVHSAEILNDFHQSQAAFLTCLPKSEQAQLVAMVRQKDLDGYKKAFLKLLEIKKTKGEWLDCINRVLNSEASDFNGLSQIYRSQKGKEQAHFIPSEFEQVNFVPVA